MCFAVTCFYFLYFYELFTSLCVIGLFVSLKSNISLFVLKKHKFCVVSRGSDSHRSWADKEHVSSKKVNCKNNQGNKDRTRTASVGCWMCSVCVLFCVHTSEIHGGLLWNVKDKMSKRWSSVNSGRPISKFTCQWVHAGSQDKCSFHTQSWKSVTKEGTPAYFPHMQL